MDPSLVHAHYQLSRERKILLSFMGLMTQRIMMEYGKILNERGGLSENSRALLFGIFVELTQNILRYSSEQAPSLDGNHGVGVVIVAEDEDCFSVASGNYVLPARAAELDAHLNQLESLDAAGLKALHRERRRTGPPPGSMGAGLGLIEVARRASSPPKHTLQTTRNGEIFFAISVPVKKDEIVSS